MNKPKSIEEWKEIITTARERGLTDKDWCMANDVSINTFYYNVRRLRILLRILIRDRIRNIFRISRRIIGVTNFERL